MVAISVVMPVYNPPLAMLDIAIESILSQTCRDFEFLILNDGSNDGETKSHLDCWAARDPRLRILHEPHRGLTATLNRGLSLAQGEFIARQDADDWSEPDRFSLQLCYLRAYPEVALAGTDTQLHRADGKCLWRLRLSRTPSKDFFKGNPFVHGSTMYRRDLALAIGGYREQFPCSQDYDFFWRLSEQAGAVNLDQVLYHYRYTGVAVSAQRASDQSRIHKAAQMLARVRQKGEPENIPSALASAGNLTFSETLRAALKQADHLMLAGDFSGARRAYFELLKSHPGSGLAWAKMIRLAIFAAIPPAREVSFR